MLSTYKRGKAVLQASQRSVRPCSIAPFWIDRSLVEYVSLFARLDRRTSCSQMHVAPTFFQGHSRVLSVHTVINLLRVCRPEESGIYPCRLRIHIQHHRYVEFGGGFILELVGQECEGS